MPRKTKETENIEDVKKKKTKAKKETEKKDKKSVASKPKAVTAKKTSSSKSSTAKSKKASTKKSTTSKSKAVTTKKVSSSKSSTAKPKKASTKKSATSKPKAVATKKTSSSKVSTTKKSVSRKKYSPEYYDLPFKYNKTVVTLLAQTPTNIFVYWEISDKDREKLKQQFGEYFFEITKPVLIIHNLTKKYSFEIDINDFANSWYIQVNDSDCKYEIELGRRPIDINYNYIPNYNKEKDGDIAPVRDSYIYISSSNHLVVPNDHVLFNWSDKIYFKNIKTNEIISKNIKDFSFIDEYGKIITIYELFRKEFGEYYLGNPSSGNPSSGSFSSIFK